MRTSSKGSASIPIKIEKLSRINREVFCSWGYDTSSN
jgi:hypothetical protein